MAKLGLKAKLVSGSTTINAGDITCPDEFAEADISTRGCIFELSAITLRKLVLDFEIPWDEADDGFMLVYNAYVNGTDLAASLTADAPNGAGFSANWQVLKCSHKEPLKDVEKAEVSMKPSGSITPIAKSYGFVQEGATVENV